MLFLIFRLLINYLILHALFTMIGTAFFSGANAGIVQVFLLAAAAAYFAVRSRVEYDSMEKMYIVIGAAAAACFILVSLGLVNKPRSLAQLQPYVTHRDDSVILVTKQHLLEYQFDVLTTDCFVDSSEYYTMWREVRSPCQVHVLAMRTEGQFSSEPGASHLYFPAIEYKYNGKLSYLVMKPNNVQFRNIAETRTVGGFNNNNNNNGKPSEGQDEAATNNFVNVEFVIQQFRSMHWQNAADSYAALERRLVSHLERRTR